MIWESRYWKGDLVRLADSLRKRTKQRRWPESSLAKLEKEIFIGFYAIRKLAEAKKLSDKVSNQGIRAESFQHSGKQRITLVNWRMIFADAYDFDSAKRIKVLPTFLCNQVIHSYIYMEVFDERRMLRGLFISSDYERNRRLYYIEIGEVIKLFARVGKDYPSHHKLHFDPVIGDYSVKHW